MAHFAKRLGFDLPDALARDADLVAEFLERARVAVHQTETLLQNFALALGETAEHIAEFVLQQTEARDFGRALSGLVLDEIAEAGFLAVADRGLERDGLLRHFHD